MGDPLIEFCVPISELYQIVDGIAEEGNEMGLQYPVEDNYLEIEIPEDFGGRDERIRSTTTLQLETYEAQHTLNPEFNMMKQNHLAQVFGKVQHFKKALREFSFLQDKELVEIRFSDSYPQL